MCDLLPEFLIKQEIWLVLLFLYCIFGSYRNLFDKISYQRNRINHRVSPKMVHTWLNVSLDNRRSQTQDLLFLYFFCIVVAAAYLKYCRYRLSCLPFIWHFFSSWHTHIHTHVSSYANNDSRPQYLPVYDGRQIQRGWRFTMTHDPPLAHV